MKDALAHVGRCDRVFGADQQEAPDGMEVTFPIAVEDHDFYDGEIWVCSRDFYGTGRGVWDPDNSCWSLLEVSHWYLDERRKQALPHGGFGSIWRYFAGALKSHAENTQFQAYLERLADEAASSC